MMQNAQMHQLFMQQMLMKGLQTEKEPQTIVVEQPHTTPPQQQPQIITVGQSLASCVIHTQPHMA